MYFVCRCIFPGCGTAFAHANRKCNRHPETPLKRLAGHLTLSPKIYADLLLENEENVNDSKSRAVRAWLRKQILAREVSMCKGNDIEPPLSSMAVGNEDDRSEFSGIWNYGKIIDTPVSKDIDSTISTSAAKNNFAFDLSGSVHSYRIQLPLQLDNKLESRLSCDLYSPVPSNNSEEKVYPNCTSLINMNDIGSESGNFVRDSVIIRHSKGYLKRENHDPQGEDIHSCAADRNQQRQRREAIIKHSTDYEFLTKGVGMGHVRKMIKRDDNVLCGDEHYIEEGHKRMMSAMALIELQNNSPT